MDFQKKIICLRLQNVCRSQESKLYFIDYIDCSTDWFGLGQCPGFSWDRVNFHKQQVGLTQTANRMGHSIPCDATLSICGELAEGEAFATQKQAEHRVVRTLCVVYAFYQYYWLLFSSPFAILLNCSHPNPGVFAFFLLIPLSIPPGRGKEWESNCVALWCKLRQNHSRQLNGV